MPKHKHEWDENKMVFKSEPMTTAEDYYTIKESDIPILYRFCKTCGKVQSYDESTKKWILRGKINKEKKS